MTRRIASLSVVPVLLLATSCGGRCDCSGIAELPSALGFTTEFGPVSPNAVNVRWTPLDGATTMRILIASEPRLDSTGALENAVELASVPANRGEYTIEGVAPGLDFFVQLAMQTPAGEERVLLYKRLPRPTTVRGEPPAATLRAVHTMAPSILMVIAHAGDGSEWQSGTWSLARRDGRQISIRSVSRHSVPVDQPDYDLGADAHNDIENVIVEHRLYLHLEEPLGSRDLLRLRGPYELDVLVPFSDLYLETPVVQLNQVGYSPRARVRYAYVSGWLGDGGGLDLASFPPVAQLIEEPTEPIELRRTGLELPIRNRIPFDPEVGAAVGEIDLAPVSVRDARFRIQIPGVGVSYPTTISASGPLKAYYTTARGMFHNRWGGDLRSEFTEWVRPPDHPRVFRAEQVDPFAMFPENTSRGETLELRGGHHDAGDFDIRPMHTVVSQLLMRAFELHGAELPDGQLGIPESGNGVPDLLDEALWSIEGFAQLQEEDGGVRAGVESFRHPPGIYFANDDPLPYWTYARNADVTARMAGVFAQASRLLAPFDAARAELLRERAERAYRYAAGHGAKTPFRLYAASELYRLTGREEFEVEFERLWSSFGPDGVFNAFALDHLSLPDYAEGQRCMPDYFLGYFGGASPSPSLRAIAIRWLDQYARDLVHRTLESRHGHRNPRPEQAGFGWGQPTVMARYLDPIFARLSLAGVREADRQDYFDAISLAADYVLGANPEGRVWIIGLGSYAPERPLHLDSLSFVHEGRTAIPGLPVFGPVSELPGNYWYRPGRAVFHPAFEEHPPLRRYADLRTFVNTNEFTVWETQAPHVEHLALLVSDLNIPPASWRPGGTDHRNPLPTFDH